MHAPPGFPGRVPARNLRKAGYRGGRRVDYGGPEDAARDGGGKSGVVGVPRIRNLLVISSLRLIGWGLLLGAEYSPGNYFYSKPMLEEIASRCGPKIPNSTKSNHVFAPSTATLFRPRQHIPQPHQTRSSHLFQCILSPEPSSELTPPPPPFASTSLSTEAQAGSIGPPHLDSPSSSALSTPNADLDNLSTLVHTGGPASLYPITPPGLAAHEPVSPDAPPAIPPPTSTTTDRQRAGPDVAAPSPHGVLASGLPSLNSAALADNHPADAVAPPEPPVAQAHVEDGSPQRKPKLVQRLKEKMHVGHGHAYS
ncbi:hypothetical protein DFH09DRAFT_1099120 [Mycena vulgaris]|nr:hypothetical protein DFH09DRAFT_1099120 [Mycena vulgaris]